MTKNKDLEKLSEIMLKLLDNELVLDGEDLYKLRGKIMRRVEAALLSQEKQIRNEVVGEMQQRLQVKLEKPHLMKSERDFYKGVIGYLELERKFINKPKP